MKERRRKAKGEHFWGQFGEGKGRSEGKFEGKWFDCAARTVWLLSVAG